jgi:hypothetical protein
MPSGLLGNPPLALSGSHGLPRPPAHPGKGPQVITGAAAESETYKTAFFNDQKLAFGFIHEIGESVGDR